MPYLDRHIAARCGAMAKNRVICDPAAMIQVTPAWAYNFNPPRSRTVSRIRQSRRSLRTRLFRLRES